MINKYDALKILYRLKKIKLSLSLLDTIINIIVGNNRNIYKVSNHIIIECQYDNYNYFSIVAKCDDYKEYVTIKNVELLNERGL